MVRLVEVVTAFFRRQICRKRPVDQFAWQNFFIAVFTLELQMEDDSARCKEAVWDEKYCRKTRNYASRQVDSGP